MTTADTSRGPIRSAAARHPAARRRPQTSFATGFHMVAAGYASLMAFGAAPTPLWPLYQQRDHFGATAVTVAFAAMVVGAAFSFGVLGHLSDRVGRRMVVVPALLVGVAAAATLAVWPTLPGLIAGRVLTGVAVGLMASTATAYLSDLYHRAHPGRPASQVPAVVANVANLGGLAMGPLIAGVLSEWAPVPLRTSYIALGAVMLLLAAALLAGPETVDTTTAGGHRAVRFALRTGGAPAFGLAAAVGFFAFAVMGFFSSLGSTIVRTELHVTSTFVVGLVPFTALAASALAQLALGKLTHPALLGTGTVLFPTGLALTTLSLYHPVMWLLLAAAGFAGAGAGLLFKGAVAETMRSAVPESRAGVFSVFFVIAYLGLGLPSIAFSLAIRHVALQPAMIGFSAVFAAGAVGAVIVALTAHREK
ncbi:MFS transporter [Streptomyces sp. PA03-6a]|nr:MFS transporter [Streptomyces sp. PA03-6a]